MYNKRNEPPYNIKLCVFAFIVFGGLTLIVLAAHAVMLLICNMLKG